MEGATGSKKARHNFCDFCSFSIGHQVVSPRSDNTVAR